MLRITQYYRKTLTTVISCDVSMNLSEILLQKSVCSEHQQNTDKTIIDLFPLQRLWILCW